MQGIAINEIEGVMVEKKICNRHQSMTDNPPGINNCISCFGIELFNQGCDAQGQVRLTLDRDKTAILIADWLKKPREINETVETMYINGGIELADALNANLKDLITVVKEN